MEAILLVALILLNGLFAMTEVAIVAARQARLERMAERGDALARSALAVTGHPTRSLSTIQIGITSIGILNGIVGEAAFARPLAAWVAGFGVPTGPSHVLATLLVVVIVTYLSIVFGELIPKRLGQINPEPLLRVLSGPLLGLGAVSGPFVRLLSGSTDVVLRALGAQRAAPPSVTEEEIELLLAEGSKAGVIEDEERRMVQNVFRLDEQPLPSLMLPRSDIVWLDLDEPIEENLRRIEASDHARYPVARGRLDHVLGVVTARRLLLRLRQGGAPDLEAVMEAPVFVPETLSGIDLLEQFRATGAQMAFVVDEYGAVQGLVTAHDLLEAIAGEFHVARPEESWAVQRADGSWLLDGALPIADLKERLGLASVPEEERGRYQTLGGMMLVLMGRIPRSGEFAEWEGWRLEIVDMDGRRIDKVLAVRRPV
uniref:HlyC/CorC family transporter n=1 Tax=Eiseniibacteriota bacterium TaxID=2212470 RepID=A0A832I1J6_UNCEI